MANQLQVKEIETETLKKLRAAFEETFKEELGIEDYYSPGQTTWAIPEVGLTYTGNQSNDDLKNYVYEITDTKSLRQADAVLAEEIEIREKNKDLEATQPKTQEENVPSAAKREAQAGELEAREAARAAATQKGIDDTKKFLDQEEKRAQRLKEILKNKKVWIREVEEPKVEKDAQVENLKQQADANPKQFVKDTEEALKESPTIANLPSEEKEVAAKQAAVTTYEVVSGSSPIVQAAIISRVVSDPKVLETIVPDAEARESIKTISDILSDTKTAQYKLSKELLDLGKLGGYKDTGDIRVELSDRALPGYREFDLNRGIVSPYSDLIAQQSTALEGLRGVAEGQIKARLLGSAGSFLDGQIAKLPAESAVSQLYNSGAVKFGLQSLGVAEASAWAAVPGSWAGKIIVGSGYGPLAGALQQFTGINLGVAKTAATAATKVLTTAGVAAGEEATAVLAGTVIAPGIGTIIAAITTFIVTNWSTIKKWIEDNSKYFLGLGALFFVGGLALGSWALAGVGTGLGVLGGAGAMSAGLGMGQIASSVGGLVLALGGATLGAIGIPILVTLLTFPVVVALILFIINSGAYIVPPSPLNLPPGASIVSPYMSVSKVANPAGPFKNTDFPITVEYQVTITPTRGSLSKVRISYSCSVIKRQGSVGCPATTPSVPSGLQIPNTISPASPYTFSYQQTYTAANFQDSFITDVINVTADTPEQTGVEAAGSAGVKIGNPPDSCPNGWPVTGNYIITQTPGGAYSHSRIEAMDIATPLGIPVRTTHSGVAHVVRTSGPYKPVYIDITSNCGGVQFTSRYAHLLVNSVAVTDGQQVTMGQLLGSSGTDIPNNSHLHYEFIGLTMTPPYLPKAIRRACSSNTGSCGSIP